jgi:DNA replication protein DnaC
MQQLATALPGAVPTTNTMPLAPARPAPETCPLCGNLGIMGWKTPRHYPLSEVQFCECPAGQRAQSAERAKAAATQQDKLKAAFTRAGIPAHFHGLTIDTLAAVAGDDPDKTKAIEVARTMVEQGMYQDKPGVFLFGSYGCGKTGVLTPVLRHWLDQGHSGLWIEFYDFCEEIQSKYGKGDEASQAMDLVRSVEWLMMDDIGDVARKDLETDDKRKLLYQIVNHRHNHVRPMLITSNLTPGEFTAQFGARTFERIAECCAVVKIGGRNLRRPGGAK